MNAKHTPGPIRFTLEINLDPRARPDEAEAALRNLGAWAGRMVQDSLPEELELIRWHIPSIACVRKATLYRHMDAAAALAEKAALDAATDEFREVSE